MNLFARKPKCEHRFRRGVPELVLRYTGEDGQQVEERLEVPTPSYTLKCVLCGYKRGVLPVLVFHERHS